MIAIPVILIIFLWWAFASYAQELPAKDYVGFSPSKSNLKVKIGNDMSMYRAGIGYSRIDRELLLPMFVSSQPTEIQGQEPHVTSYPDADTMMQTLYGSSDTMTASMYSHREAGDALYRDFFLDNTRGVIASTEYTYLASSVANEFEKYAYVALKKLPVDYDKDVYASFCRLWGCSVVTSATFGGVIEASMALRSCASGTNTLESDMKIATTTGKFPDMSYGRFTRTQRTNIVGGNPEEVDIPTRINSFRENPIMVRASIRPLHLFLKEKFNGFPEHILNNLALAYDYETEMMNAKLVQMKEEGKKASIEDMAAQTVYFAAINAETWGHGCSAVREGCLIHGDKDCRTNACVRIENGHVPVGGRFETKEPEIHFFIINIPGHTVGLDRYPDGNVIMFVDHHWKGTTQRVFTSPFFRTGCQYFQWRWEDSTLGYFMCNGCQPWISHDGPNERFHCDCPAF